MKKVLQITLLLLLQGSIFGQYTFLGGGTQLTPQCIELTPATNNQNGWVFSTEKFDVQNGDTVEFKIHAGSNDWGADGMVFILHDDPRGLNAQGCVGEAMGYGDHPSGPTSAQCDYGNYSAIINSIGIEFDTYRNTSQGDPANDHAAFLTGGDVNHGNDYVDLGNIEDGLEHDFKFIYDPIDKRSYVYWDGNLIIEKRRNIRRRDLNRAKTAYWGFSASTGGATNQHYFCTANDSTTITFGENATAQSGDYNNPDTWLYGVPAFNQEAVILANHDVNATADLEVAALSIETDGNLSLNTNTITVNEGDVTVNGTLDATQGLLNFTATTDQSIYLTSPTEIKDISTSNSSSLTIQGDTLSLTGILSINSGVFNTSDLLVLKASPSSTAIIDEIATGASMNGKLTMEQYIYSDNKIWRYMTSPFADGLVSDLQNEIPITGVFSDPSSGDGMRTNSPSMYAYDETISGTSLYGYTAFPAKNQSATSTVMEPGEGYAVYQRGAIEKIDMFGTPNQGDITVDLTFTETGLDEEDGWNLVGNPYPCAISWDKISSSQRNGVEAAVFITDNTSGTPVVQTYLYDEDLGFGFGTNGGTGVISPYQAVWIKTDASNPSITFQEEDKTTQASTYYRQDVQLNLLSIKVSQNGLSDETLLRLKENATSAYSNTSDARKVEQEYISVQTFSTENIPLGINSLSLAENEVYSTLVDIFNVGSGDIYLEINGGSSIDDEYNITLFDYLQGESYDLKNEEGLFLQIEDNEVTDRFEIIVSKKQALVTEIEDDVFTNIEVAPNPNSGTNIFVSGLIDTDYDYEIINQFGTTISNGIVNETLNVIDLSNISMTGVYFIKLSTDIQVVTKRILVERP